MPVKLALDVGCGAGASSAALLPMARQVIGVEPQMAMLAFCQKVAPQAMFAVGRAERLPFAANVFDLISAAGVLNYADVPQALAEIARVMTPSGRFVPYDFSAGSRCRDDPRLARWHESFKGRYPSPGGYALDLSTMDYAAHGLVLTRFETFEVELSMHLSEYLNYLLGEAGVEYALARGEPESAVRDAFERELSPLFIGEPKRVVFDALLAVVHHHHASDGLLDRQINTLPQA